MISLHQRLAGKTCIVTGSGGSIGRAAALRFGAEGANVVGCDIVELSPLPGNIAPNFLCAKLLYKILSYRFGTAVRATSGALQF